MPVGRPGANPALRASAKRYTLFRRWPTRHSGAMRSIEPQMRNCASGNRHSGSGPFGPSRNDVRHSFVLAGHDRPELILSSCPSKQRGRGECRVPNAPAASCAHRVVEYAHEYSQRRHRKTSGIPHAMVYGLLRALPGDYRFVDPVIRATRWRLANLTPASGRQNHTASPSATASARRTLRCVHRIPPHVP